MTAPTAIVIPVIRRLVASATPDDMVRNDEETAETMQTQHHHDEMDGTPMMAAFGTPLSDRGHFGFRNSARPSRGTDPMAGPGRGWRGFQSSTTASQLPVPTSERRAAKSSATWTSSSGDLAGLSDTDDIQNRNHFVDEYNRLAKKVTIAQHPST